MKITAIETTPVSVPIDPVRAIRGSTGLHSESPFLLVRIHTDSSHVGLGEVSCTPRWSGEDHVTARRMIETVLAPLLIGQDPTDVSRLSTAIDAALPNNAFTRAGFEMALWDLLGKIAGLPLYRLLGGPVREFVPTKFSISGSRPSEAADIAAWAVEQGFRAMKVKVGIDLEEDVKRVRAVRGTVGPNVRLGVDANGAWTPREAVTMIRRLSEFDLMFVEQPSPAGDPVWLAEVRARTDVPILADESVYTPQDALALTRENAVDALSIYVGKGGIGSARQIAAIAQAAGVACTVGSNLELGIAAAAQIHLAMATSGVWAEAIPCDILTPFYYAHSLLAEPLRIEAGRAYPPEQPGFGVELDEKVVRKYEIHL